MQSRCSRLYVDGNRPDSRVLPSTSRARGRIGRRRGSCLLPLLPRPTRARALCSVHCRPRRARAGAALPDRRRYTSALAYNAGHGARRTMDRPVPPRRRPLARRTRRRRAADTDDPLQTARELNARRSHFSWSQAGRPSSLSQRRPAVTDLSPLCSRGRRQQQWPAGRRQQEPSAAASRQTPLHCHGPGPDRDGSGRRGRRGWDGPGREGEG